MTSYHLSIHKICDSYTGLDTYSSREIQLDNEQDFATAKQLCEDEKHMAGFWKQTVLPIRTDRASDVFFPTLMNLVIKTKSLAESFFAVLAAIIWDLATLPIRLAAYFPRMAYNATITPEEHPLIPYLKGKDLTSLDVEGTSPVNVTFNQNENVVRFLEKDGRVNVVLYSKEIVNEGRAEARNGEIFKLYLTDREIAFPIRERITFFNKHSLDNQPLPEAIRLRQWSDQLINARS